MDHQYFWEGMSMMDLARVQKSLSSQISQEGDPDLFQIIAGYDSIKCKNIHIGALVYFDYQNGKIIQKQTQIIHIDNDLEYHSGYLSLYEMPIFLELWRNRPIDPDLVVIDGNGILHPNRCGFASHLSFIIDKATFGISKKLLGGEYRNLKLVKGESTKIVYQEQIGGRAICTRTGTKPVFISIGNRIDLNTCTEIALRFSNYRIPELTRQPDLITRDYCRKHKNSVFKD